MHVTGYVHVKSKRKTRNKVESKCCRNRKNSWSLGVENSTPKIGTKGSRNKRNRQRLTQLLPTSQCEVTCYENSHIYYTIGAQFRTTIFSLMIKNLNFTDLILQYIDFRLSS